MVVNIACRASDTVLRIAKANDIAPRRPKHTMEELFNDENILLVKQLYQQRIAYAENS